MPRDIYHTEEKTFEKIDNGVNEKVKEDDHSLMLDVTGLQVTIMSLNSGIKSVLLPWPASGNYYFDSNDEFQLGKYIYLKEVRGRWVAHGKKPAFFRDGDRNRSFEVSLYSGCIYFLENAGDNSAILARYSNKKSNVFHNYIAEMYEEIRIGKKEGNDIQYSNPTVSREHCKLYWKKTNWIVEDLDSLNGTYVNDKRVKEAVLLPGDCVFVMGLRILIGIGFFSINDEIGGVVLSSKLRKVRRNDIALFKDFSPQVRDEEPLFNRLPRKRAPLSADPIIIEAPPMPLNNNGIPLVLRMGGSMVMGTTAMLAGHFTSILSSVLFPMLTQRYTERQKKEYEEKRQEKYSKYLSDIKLRIENEAEHEKEVLNQNYPRLSEVLRYTENGRRLWERRNVDDDFLDIRVGYGTIPLIAERKYPERQFEMDEDNLLEAMYKVAEEPVGIPNAPIMTSLVKDYVCGILGEHKLVHLFLARIIMQIAIAHSYDEVKLVLLTKEENLETVEIVRYLPHLWNDQKDFRFLAMSQSDASRISEYLKGELDKDIQKPRELKEILKERPYFVVIASDKKIFDSMEILKDVMKCDKNCGVSVITAFDELPKECMKVFHLHKNGNHSIAHLNQIELPDKYFRMDDYNRQEAEQSIRKICNTRLRVVSQSYSLPKMVTFLEMYGVGSVEQLNPLKRWEENNPLKSLAVPVGVATDGTLFTLDLHEKFQGPHGLIAGMTGSGKSEFIITFILSLAVNFSPEEVTFILIDYKGGGLARAFDDEARELHLPHLVGTITNLDGTAIQRSMKAIQSELLRRQRLFNEAKSAVNEGSMDIYEYQKLYRNHQVKEPLPHLFLISDEFAELRKQEPDFMDKLISTARIGRSLGVHLILATQKPSGVVNDQIWSNSKFRVCLKVQDKSDSLEMLKRPEAAELKDTGRFYLQVGYNEFFALGQSAWCGADYEKSDSVIVHKDETVQILDSVGQVLSQAKPESQKEKAQGKQLDAIVRYLSEIAAKNRYNVRALWREPLPEKLGPENMNGFMQDMDESEQFAVNLGLIDDPENQNQFPLFYDFAKSNHLLVVGEPGTGKTILLQSMILSLVENLSARDINIYAIDFSSKMLRMFKKLPQIGEVIEEEEEASIRLLFEMLRVIVEERKQLFASLEVSSFEEARQVKRIPLILVFIDNYAGFAGSRTGSICQNNLHLDLKNAISYGIKFIITSSRLNDVSMRVRQEIGDRIALQVRDKYDFGEILGCRCSYYPPNHPGRGLYCIEGRPLEYQALMYWPDLSGTDRSRTLKKYIQGLVELNRESIKARRIPSNQEASTYEELLEHTPINRIPLGYTLKNPRPIALPLKQFSKLQVYFGNPDSVVPVLENILRAVAREQMEVILVKRNEGSCFENLNERRVSKELLDKTEIITMSSSDLINLWRKIVGLVQARKELLVHYCKENNLDASKKNLYMDTFNYMKENCQPVCILVEEFSEFCICMDDASSKVFCALFDIIRLYQIYVIGCFYPESKFYERDVIYRSFSDEKIALMFGGQLNLQSLCELPTEYRGAYQKWAYNNFLVHYKDNNYLMRMPYKEDISEEEELEPDDRDIFKE